MTELQYDTSLIAQLFDAQPDAVLWFFPICEAHTDVISDYEIRYCNSPASKLLHHSSQVLTGTRLTSTSAFDEETRLQIIAQCNHVMATGESIQTTSFNTSLNKHFAIRRSKVLNGVLTVARDRTREVTADTERKKLENQMSAVMDASMNAILVLEPVVSQHDDLCDLKIHSINNAGALMLRFPEENRRGHFLSALLHPHSFDEFFKLHKQVLDSNSAVQTEQFLRFNTGEGWYVISVSPCNEGVVTVLQERTDIKKLEQQLEFTLEGLKRSNDRLTEFTYVASHDLNEPLRKVATFSRLLSQKLGENIETGVKDYLSRIENSIQRMQVLLENLLIYSRVSKPVGKLEQVQLNTVVREAQRDLQNIICAKAASVTVADLPTVEGDGGQLRQAFVNVLSNAIKFQPADNNPVITISHRISSRYHIIDIADNGIGFDAAYSAKIFELFQRLHPRHEYEGTGIGLAIVQRAMENHKGFVEVKSQPGVGSVFSLCFPVVD